MNAGQAIPREMAWEEFRAKYGPVIAGFAKNLGAHQPGYRRRGSRTSCWGSSQNHPRLFMIRQKGAFRGYLSSDTVQCAGKSRVGQNAKFMGLPLDDQVDPAAPAIENTWEQEWQQQQLKLRTGKCSASATREEQHLPRRFELLVLVAEPVEQVAEKLHMSPDSIYQAKSCG